MGLTGGAAAGHDRAAIEQAGLVAEAVPARAALAGEQLQICSPRRGDLGGRRWEPGEGSRRVMRS
jgi:hypothetical protein